MVRRLNNHPVLLLCPHLELCHEEHVVQMSGAEGALDYTALEFLRASGQMSFSGNIAISIVSISHNPHTCTAKEEHVHNSTWIRS